ncbi:MAG: HAMP domain-containing histidine kinase [Pseudobutyrivibrio sp.]|nr:HAMP domain-containing histidine kinase [Pseudobutyrivibrio sp.]
MSEKSIQRLKNKFIMTAMVSFFLVMTFIAGCIYLCNALITRGQIKDNLTYIVENDGVLPMEYENVDSHGNKDDKENTISSKNDFVNQLQKFFGVESEYFSNEFYYSARYFAVTYDKNGEVDSVITNHTAEVDADQAVTYANTVLTRWFSFGSYDDYYYMVADQDDGTIVVVIDCSSQISINRRLVWLACILIGFGMVISAFVIRMWAERLVQPEIKNAELQKSFITNASHELKTPLAVIKANTEMLEMMGTENEWTESTMRQVDRLTGLIQNLVLVTRASEKDSKEERVETDFTAIVNDTAKAFEPVAIQDGKTLDLSIAEGVSMLAHEGDIRQIATLLIDNAIKYCDEKGRVTIGLGRDKKKKNIYLRVSNSYESGAGKDYARFFDRFYRGDEAHNIDKEGYGVGLSIAQGLMERYHGDIKVSYRDGIITFTCKF